MNFSMTGEKYSITYSSLVVLGTKMYLYVPCSNAFTVSMSFMFHLLIQTQKSAYKIYFYPCLIATNYLHVIWYAPKYIFHISVIHCIPLQVQRPIKCIKDNKCKWEHQTRHNVHQQCLVTEHFLTPAFLTCLHCISSIDCRFLAFLSLSNFRSSLQLVYGFKCNWFL